MIIELFKIVIYFENNNSFNFLIFGKIFGNKALKNKKYTRYYVQSLENILFRRHKSVKLFYDLWLI